MDTFQCGGRWWFVGQQITARGFLLHGWVVGPLNGGGDWLTIRVGVGAYQSVHVSLAEPAP